MSLIHVLFKDGRNLVTDAPRDVFENNIEVLKISDTDELCVLSYDYLNKF